MKPILEVERELDPRLAAMGFELVDTEWSGNRVRPKLRVRVDRPDSAPGRGITVDDCARISRTLEEWLDGHEAVSERYVLEVSSPGVERPLVRRRDFGRFRGREVELKVAGVAGSESSRLVRGRLGGVKGEGEAYDIVVETPDGGEVRVSRDEVLRAKLVFRWNEED